MEAVGRGMDAWRAAVRLRQCDAHAADGNDSGAGALQESEHECRTNEELRIEKRILSLCGPAVAEGLCLFCTCWGMSAV